MVVPELPQSSGAAAARSPAKPTPCNARLAVLRARTLDPQRAQRRAPSTGCRRRARARSPRPARRTSAPNSSARCEIDLSPGTRQRPVSGPERGTRSRLGGDGRSHRRITTMNVVGRPLGGAAVLCRASRQELQRPSYLLGEHLAPVGRQVQPCMDPRPLGGERQPVQDRAEPQKRQHRLPGGVANVGRPGRGGGARRRRHRRTTPPHRCPDPQRGRAAPPGAAAPAVSRRTGRPAPHGRGDGEGEEQRGPGCDRRPAPVGAAPRGAGPRVGRDPPGGVDGPAHRVRLALRQRPRGHERHRSARPPSHSGLSRQRPRRRRPALPRRRRAPTRAGSKCPRASVRLRVPPGASLPTTSIRSASVNTS